MCVREDLVQDSWVVGMEGTSFPGFDERFRNFPENRPRKDVPTGSDRTSDGPVLLRLHPYIRLNPERPTSSPPLLRPVCVGTITYSGGVFRSDSDPTLYLNPPRPLRPFDLRWDQQVQEFFRITSFTSPLVHKMDSNNRT